MPFINSTSSRNLGSILEKAAEIEPRFRLSGVTVADDVYPGTKHYGASVSSLYLLEKMENKTNRSIIFWN